MTPIPDSNLAFFPPCKGNSVLNISPTSLGPGGPVWFLRIQYPQGNAGCFQLDGPRGNTLLSFSHIDLKISAPLSHPQEPISLSITVFQLEVKFSIPIWSFGRLPSQNTGPGTDSFHLL